MSEKLRSVLKELDELHCDNNDERGRYAYPLAMEFVEAWREEHPADDEEPVTEEWLRSVGFEFNEDLTWPILSSPIGESRLGGPMVRLRFEPLHGCDGWHVGFIDEWSQIIDLPCRGDVRRLCKALGIELKEAK